MAATRSTTPKADQPAGQPDAPDGSGLTLEGWLHLLRGGEAREAPDLAARWAFLREPFPEESLGLKPQPLFKRDDNRNVYQHCPVCEKRHTLPAIHLPFVGHAFITERLNQVDPLWEWKPKGGWLEDGSPRVTASGNMVKMWGDLTVLGVTRPGVGDADGIMAHKEIVGDFLRNAGMRFGMALDLWKRTAGKDDYDDAVWPDGQDPVSARKQDAQKARQSGTRGGGQRRQQNGGGQRRQQAEKKDAAPAAPTEGPEGETELDAVRRSLELAEGKVVRVARDVCEELGLPLLPNFAAVRAAAAEDAKFNRALCERLGQEVGDI